MALDLHVGVHSEIITPPLGSQMAGFAARTGVARGVHDDLHARALVVDDGTTIVALISVEIIGIDRRLADRIREEICRRTGVPAAHVVISATHTHCGPATFRHFFNQTQSLDTSYIDVLGERIIRCVEQAMAKRKRSRLRAGLVPVENIAVNRRTDGGKPIDPYAGVVVVEEEHGGPLAIAVYYACHPTVLGPNTLSITADFPFFMGERLKEELGEQTEVLFFNGAEGDLSIGHKSNLSAVGVIDPFRTFDKARELGWKLARFVLDGLAELSVQGAPVAVCAERIRLPLKRYELLEQMTKHREESMEQLRRLEAQDHPVAEEVLQAKQAVLFDGIEEYYARLYDEAYGEDPKTLEAEMMAIRIGETALITFPGEAFVDIALDIRQLSGFATTLFLGLSNDYIGYIPNEGASASEGYEVVAARVDASASGLLTDAAVDLLRYLEGEALSVVP